MTTPAEKNKFYLEVDDLLGFKYKSYMAKLTALSLSKPAEYNALRDKVMESVKVEAVREVYKTLFAVMTVGTTKDGTALIVSGGSSLPPHYPSNKVNDLCLTIANDMADHIDRVIDIILPGSFDKVSAASLSLKGRATLLE